MDREHIRIPTSVTRKLKIKRGDQITIGVKDGTAFFTKQTPSFLNRLINDPDGLVLELQEKSELADIDMDSTFTGWKVQKPKPTI